MESGNGIEYYGHTRGSIEKAFGNGRGAARGYANGIGNGFGFAYPFDVSSLNSQVRGVSADGAGNGTAGFAYSGDGLGSPELVRAAVQKSTPTVATASRAGITLLLLRAASLDIIILHAQILQQMKTLKG